jgi:Putative peptidoglycan binding domain
MPQLARPARAPAACPAWCHPGSVASLVMAHGAQQGLDQRRRTGIRATVSRRELAGPSACGQDQRTHACCRRDLEVASARHRRAAPPFPLPLPNPHPDGRARLRGPAGDQGPAARPLDAPAGHSSRLANITIPAHVTRELSFDAVIRKGDMGLKVRRVQEWLSIHNCPTPVDGDFGPATEKCVKDSQKLQGTSVTGTVNRTTWQALTAPLTHALASIKLPVSLSVAQAMLQVAQSIWLSIPSRWEATIEDHGQGVHGRESRDRLALVRRVHHVCHEAGVYVAGSTDAYRPFVLVWFAGVSGDRILREGHGSRFWCRVVVSAGTAQVFLLRSTPTDCTHTGLSFGATCCHETALPPDLSRDQQLVRRTGC